MAIIEDRLVDSDLQPEEVAIDWAMRPQSLKEYIGQKQVVEQMDLFIRAAKNRKESLDHILLFGPPGLGKTTLAHIVAHEMGGSIKTTSGPALEKTGDLASLLTNLEPGSILFIDEIHRIPAIVEEMLYPAMEDFTIELRMGVGPAARSLQLKLPAFTLIGATTRAGLLAAPFRDRFGIAQHLEFYRAEDLSLIIQRSASLLNLTIDHDAAYHLAIRSRGTPRIANRLLRRIRDYAQVHHHHNPSLIALSIVEKALDLFHINKSGLDFMDQKIISVIIEKFHGGPVGLQNLASAIGEDARTIEDMIEPYLIQQGWIIRTPRGRMITERGMSAFASCIIERDE